eukprot:TRINITY_DN3140_c11_g1_i1.p1 TRINITY_DN3140_c11_g1~~TRINITY_DN3140_c11_g1_i1.p1  ORF type:complete len:347 (+),score=69.42 TRINITY_DN3140_c11_g1_i1:94-1134(+)
MTGCLKRTRVLQDWGLRVSEQASQYENFRMASPAQPFWRQQNPLRKGDWVGWSPMTSYTLPKGKPGKGIEYRKFFGEQRVLTPSFLGGPHEAAHDENRNRVFHNPMTFPAVPQMVRHSRTYITTRRKAHYGVPLYSKAALTEMARQGFNLANRKLIWNPHHAHQPVEGPAELTANEMEVYRKQAFLAGIDFPEFPDVAPVEQKDPWEEQSPHFRVPEENNDRLLDADMWEEIGKNMKGMEAKIRAFKDNERKKLWVWKQARLASDFKRAKMESVHMKSQKMRMQQSAKAAERAGKTLKPWQRKEMAEAPQDVSEHTEAVETTELQRKEQARLHTETLQYKPPGFKD